MPSESGRTYVISDIHGCFDQFMAIMDRIELTPNDRMYVIGDVIDRGPKSGDMVNWVVNERPSNVTMMLGNHEMMMLEDCHDPGSMHLRFMSDWAFNGGAETAEQMEELSEATRVAFFDICREEALDSTTVEYIGDDGKSRSVCLVHAGLAPSRKAKKSDDITEAMDTTLEFDKMWVREPWLMGDWRPPMDVIFGHTPTPLLADMLLRRYGSAGLLGNNKSLPDIEQVRRGESGMTMSWNGRTDIDCGCVYGGQLACLRLEDGAVFYERMAE